MTANIYDQHDAAFRNVSAYVVCKDGERVATIAVKFGAGGRVTAFVHWIGLEMVRGHADGGGYDKTSAALAKAVRKITPTDDKDAPYGKNLFIKALADDGAHSWERFLRDAGFTVFQAV